MFRISIFRFLAVFLVSLSMLGGGQVTAQETGSFTVTAFRGCEDNSVNLQFSGESIPPNFRGSVHNTSNNWSVSFGLTSPDADRRAYYPVQQNWDVVVLHLPGVEGVISLHVGDCGDEGASSEDVLVGAPDNPWTPDSFTASATMNCTDNSVGIVFDPMGVLGMRWAVVNSEDGSKVEGGTNPTTGSFNIVRSEIDLDPHFERYVSAEFVFDKVVLMPSFGSGEDFTYTIDVGNCGDIPGGGAQGPLPGNDGSYNDPATGNSFEFLTANRMCEDNRLVTTWSGTNLVELNLTAYSPSNGWGTDWLAADAASGMFTTDIQRDTSYLVDADVHFTDESRVMVTVAIPDCTENAEIPDAGIGENSLQVQFDLPDGASIEGAPYGLYAPQAAMQAVGPLLTGTVGANNTVSIDGLIPGQYRLVVSPAGMDPIEAMITVGDQPLTRATVTLDEEGAVTIAYAAQVVPTPSPAATEAPGDSASGSGSTAAPATSGSSVSGLPQTGSGTLNTIPVMLAAAAITVLGGLSLISRYGATRKQ